DLGPDAAFGAQLLTRRAPQLPTVRVELDRGSEVRLRQPLLARAVAGTGSAREALELLLAQVQRLPEPLVLGVGRRDAAEDADLRPDERALGEGVIDRRQLAQPQAAVQEVACRPSRDAECAVRV